MPDRPYIVQTDIIVARRKRIHAVHDPGGVPVFHARHLIEVMDWLVNNDVHHARFTDDETTYDVSFVACAPGAPFTDGEPHG